MTFDSVLRMVSEQNDYREKERKESLMRLKTLTIKNFKGIDEHGICIELAPITLLFGPNNVGKSTIIQALHLAREVFCGDIPEKIEACRHGVELGTYKDYVHKHELDRTIHIGFSFTTKGMQHSQSDTLPKILCNSAKLIGVDILIRWNEQRNRAELSDYIMSVNGKKFATLQKDSPLEAKNPEEKKNVGKTHAESYLCVYDITPFIADEAMKSLKSKRDELIHRLPKAEQIEQARLFFKSADWKDFLKSYFEAIPPALFSVSNVNVFLKQLDIGTEFLNDSGLEELYEKPFYSTEPIPMDFSDSIKRIPEKFPDTSELVKRLTEEFSDSHDVLTHIIKHFGNDFDSIKRLCEYIPETTEKVREIFILNSTDFDGIKEEKGSLLHCFYELSQMVPPYFASVKEGKHFYSPNDCRLYYDYLEDEIEFCKEANRNHYTYKTGTISLVREISSPVNFNYESLKDDLGYFHFPKSNIYSGWENEPINSNFLSLFSWPVEEIGHYLDSLLYVGPLRKIPERGENGLWFRELGGIGQSKAHWFEGVGAWEWMATASDEALDELNEKLNGPGSLETGFTVKRHQYIRLKKGSKLFHVLEQAQHAGLGEAEKLSLTELLEQPPAEVQLALYNERTGLETEPYNMGTGVSQVLPVVAASVAAGSDKLAILEQPELHIHPKLQTTLGDIFLQAANKGAMFLLETHSEHLLLRLLKRIRHTHDGKAHEKLNFRHTNLAVNWIGNNDGHTHALWLEVDEDGSFNTPWPEGFFDERGEELFG